MEKLPDKISMLSFDPGLTKAGWSEGVYTVSKNRLKLNNSGTIKAKSIVARVDFREQVEKFGERTVVLNLVEEIIGDLLTKYKPKIVVVEDAFFNRMRPTAFAPLIQWLYALSRTCRIHGLKPYRIPARTVKLQVTAKGDTGKFGVRRSLLEKENIDWSKRMLKNQTEFSEHEIDSMAIMYTFCVLGLQDLLADQKSG